MQVQPRSHVTPTTSIPYTFPKYWFQPLREVYLSWLFIKRDVSAAVFPGWMFLMAAWLHATPHFDTLLPTIGRGILYFWLYIYSFCLANQITGIEEDRVNKPDRLLVRGIVSLPSTYLRWAIVMVLYSLVAWWLGVLLWALLWQAITILYNFFGWAKRWYLKDLSMSLGTVAQLAAAWQLVAPITPTAWSWIMLAAAAMFPLFSTQDLRDMAGDRAIGRSTLPLAMGDPAIRYFLATGFSTLPILTYLVVLRDTGILGLIALLIQATLCITVAVRLLRYRTTEGDHRTYMVFTYWYCVFLASAIVVM